MNLSKTIKNIRASCKNYMDPNLFAFLIDDDDYMGTNNILELDGYGIEDSDSYEERLLKICKKENVFFHDKNFSKKKFYTRLTCLFEVPLG